jgi:pseudaminic acid cytidylyltransferase
LTRSICVIPARGGSVRIPRKNIREFHGKPMFHWSCQTARASGLFDVIVVSTDDNDIAAAMPSYVVPFRRPTDSGVRGTQSVAREVLELYPSAMACVLYPCAPMISWRDLVRGYRALMQPYHHVFAISTDHGGNDAGGFYWGFTRAFLDDVPLEGTNVWQVPVGRHFDINTEDDWKKAEEAFKP